ncbi:MAG: hypothetical protein EDM05_023085 [Leptolyngbya sp. IPPAS B-1204]|nr:MAG: hypothetical protein EDM05_18640 [Leptolyngbya sp. IPPAS B-1204]
MTTKVWFVVRLAVALSVLGSAIGGATMPGFAQDSLPPQPSSEPDAGVASLIPAGEPVEQSASRSVGGAELQSATAIPHLDELEQPATTVTDWLAQIEASIVEITGVRVEETETGLQVIPN